MKALKDEDEYIVWESIAGGIEDLANVLQYAPGDVMTEFNAFVVEVMKPLGTKLGWDCHDGEESTRSILRAVVHSRLMRAGDEDTIKHAMAIFNEHVKSRRPLTPDLRLCIFGGAVRNGGEETFNQMLKLYETAGFPEIERNCITALSQTQDPKLLQRLFNYSINEGKARAHDYVLLFYGASTSKVGQQFLWKYFKDNMIYLAEKFGGVGSGLFQRCMKMSIEKQCSEEFAQEVEKFFCSTLSPQDQQTLSRLIKQGTEAVRLNKMLLESNADDIAEYLKEP
ncbi:hypothetical protein Q1695_008754 [Nippostrongylus brasiliensis]|nr:hypothetical protein Q1695_008754 [Nippostrongylus brasiliensis]